VTADEITEAKEGETVYINYTSNTQVTVTVARNDTKATLTLTGEGIGDYQSWSFVMPASAVTVTCANGGTPK